MTEGILGAIIVYVAKEQMEWSGAYTGLIMFALGNSQGKDTVVF